MAVRVPLLCNVAEGSVGAVHAKLLKPNDVLRNGSHGPWRCMAEGSMVVGSR